MPKIVNHQQRRTDIARAAGQVIADKGLEGAKLIDIGKAAGVTTGAIGHYYTDKEAVLSAALEQAYQDTISRIEMKKQQQDYTLFDVMMADLPTDQESQETKAVWLAFWSRAIAEKDIAAHQEKIHKHWLATVAVEITEHCRRKNQPAPIDAEDKAEILTAFINGLIVRALVSPQLWPKERLEELLRIQLNGQGLN
jgi:AcrR family transcriptional regulator